MFNRSECTYWSLKCYIMLGNEFFIDFIKRYWIICIRGAVFRWNSFVQFMNKTWKYLFFFSFCVCKSVCLKTLELIKGFSLVWCFVCSSKMSKCEVLFCNWNLCVRLFAKKTDASFWLQRPWNLMVLRPYSHTRKSQRCGKRFNKCIYKLLLVFMPVHSLRDLIV